MGLQTEYVTEEWEIFIKAGISAKSVKNYAATFAREKLMKENLEMIDQTMLKELGITAMGEALSILKQAKESSIQTIYAKALSAKLPQLHFEMTSQQFRKFRINWGVFTRMTDMLTSQPSFQFYSCADESVQNVIISTYPKFFTTDPDRLIEMIEALVAQKSSPMVDQTQINASIILFSPKPEYP